MNLSWKAGDRTSVSVNGSRQASLLGSVKTDETVVGADLTFWMPREFRTKLTWRRRVGQNIVPAAGYGLTVDKSF
jgi:hypothetical protein